METKDTCMICGEGALHVQESERATQIDDKQFTVPFRVHACDKCGATVGLGDDLRFNARAIRRVNKQHHGLLTGQEVREVRKNLGLSQELAARLFGGGPVAFSKYENDEVTQSEAMDRLVWLVGQAPWLLGMIAERLGLTLSGESRITIASSRTEYWYEAYAQLSERWKDNRGMLLGYSHLSSASNEKVYRSDSEPRPAERLVA